MKQSLEEKIAHLEIIQGVIGRLANNSSSMKSLSGTVVAAAIALYGAGAKANWLLLMGAVFPVLVFWFLDARYLKIECAYRQLYDAVRRDQVIEPFSMDYKPFEQCAPNLFAILCSWSVSVVYLVLLFGIGIIALTPGWGSVTTKAVGT